MKAADGASVNDHWAVAKKRLAKRGKASAAPPPKLPPEASVAWEAFVDLDDGRGMGMEPEPISYTEIMARQAALGFPLRPWEVTAVRRLDRLRRRIGDSGGSNGGGQGTGQG